MSFQSATRAFLVFSVGLELLHTLTDEVSLRPENKKIFF